MSSQAQFKGFPKEAVRFLQGLKKHNSRDWFESHRDDYDEHLIEPARSFVVAMGEGLRTIAPAVVADPRVNGSLFRLNRDTRFSKDKTPYKTNVGIFFWEGEGKRMECPGFYFHLEPPKLMVGVGMYMFPKELLDVYRDAVVDPKLGPALKKAVTKVGPLVGRTGCGLDVPSYKKVPRGYDPDHPNAEFLKYKGLSAGMEAGIPKELYSPKLIAYCLDRFRKLVPLHRWLVQMNERA